MAVEGSACWAPVELLNSNLLLAPARFDGLLAPE
jgi:hypothetical protein